MIALYCDCDHHLQVNLIAIACGIGSGALIWKDLILARVCVCVFKKV